jgi:acid stress-induced BolA-like protein IbaG/YrbA
LIIVPERGGLVRNTVGSRRFATLKTMNGRHMASLARLRGKVRKMEPREIKTIIEAGVPGALVRVSSSDNTHFEAVVVSDAFEDKSRLARHKLVYRCLGALMGNEIHALSIRAYTAGEWRRLQPD